MRHWWHGTRLVAGRGLAEQLRSRSFKVVTGLLLLISTAAIAVPQIIGDDGSTYTLVTVGEVSPGVASFLEGAAGSAEFTVEFKSRRSLQAVRDLVADGEATAGLAGRRLFTSVDAGGTFPVLVGQAVVAEETESRLREAGLSAEEVADVRSVRPPEQVPVSQVADESRAHVGFTVGVVLYLALTFGGSAIATTVALEKSTRISEVLLAMLRPSQALVGTVLALGTVTLLQVLVLAVPLVVAVTFTDAVGLPAVAAADITLAVVWFLLGFVMYAFLFAASAALVNKVIEANTAIMPVMALLIAAYLLALTVVTADPGSVASVTASLFPFTAPVAMPVRWASGQVPAYQLVVAMALTAVTAAVLARLASAIYARALLITGRRARWREVLR